MLDVQIPAGGLTASAPGSALRLAQVMSIVVVITHSYGCGGATSEREEAQQLLAAVTDLDVDDSADKRYARLQALGRLRLTYEPLRQTRDRCVGAHTALMLAEAAQAVARAQLLEARGPDAGGSLSPRVAAEVSRAIRRSNSQLEVATSEFGACRAATRRLAVKHR